MVSVPSWLLTLAVGLVVSLIGTLIGFAASYAKVKVLVEIVQKTCNALHDRVDKLESIVATLDKDVAILRDVEERRERRYTPIGGMPTPPHKP